MTEGSFDAYMWQALETKARFISQVMTGDVATRRAEDIGGQELSYAEVKAIASGNPAVLTLAEADAELQRLAVLRKNHADEQYLARRNVRDLPETIDWQTKRLADLTTDLGTLHAHAEDAIVIGERRCRREDVQAVLGNHLESVPELVPQTRRFPLGVYRGLRFGIVIHPNFSPEVYLEGASSRKGTLSHEFHGPRAVMNAVERLASGTESQSIAAGKDLALSESQLRDYQARLGKPFTHHAYQADLVDLRDRLKVALSATNPEPGTDPRPTTQELADRIRALKDSQTLDSPPPAARLSNRSPTAERPVTARIRERREQEAASIEPIVESEEEESPEASAPTTQEPPSAKEPPQEIVAPSVSGQTPLPAREVADRDQGRAKQMRMF